MNLQRMGYVLYRALVIIEISIVIGCIRSRYHRHLVSPFIPILYNTLCRPIMIMQYILSYRILRQTLRVNTEWENSMKNDIMEILSMALQLLKEIGWDGLILVLLWYLCLKPKNTFNFKLMQGTKWCLVSLYNISIWNSTWWIITILSLPKIVIEIYAHTLLACLYMIIYVYNYWCKATACIPCILVDIKELTMNWSLD